MPTYEFTCKSCQHHFDVFVPISQKKKVVCPQCKGKSLREFFGAVYIGGQLSNPSAGTGSACRSGSCTTCGSTCKTS
ncbi:zinc ribbon domain-containing protein [bacterium]|nr:zinc ribbon domain-containing protein [bacterium]